VRALSAKSAKRTVSSSPLRGKRIYKEEDNEVHTMKRESGKRTLNGQVHLQKTRIHDMIQKLARQFQNGRKAHPIPILLLQYTPPSSSILTISTRGGMQPISTSACFMRHGSGSPIAKPAIATAAGRCTIRPPGCIASFNRGRTTPDLRIAALSAVARSACVMSER